VAPTTITTWSPPLAELAADLWVALHEHAWLRAVHSGTE
jgi:hypothetical protein